MSIRERLSVGNFNIALDKKFYEIDLEIKCEEAKFVKQVEP